jgi:hypothetical protein
MAEVMTLIVDKNDMPTICFANILQNKLIQAKCTAHHGYKTNYSAGVSVGNTPACIRRGIETL